MDIQTFINSGMLESYVLGNCTVVEMEQVELMSRTHPEVRSELERIEQDVEVVAQRFAIKPDKALKAKVLDALRNHAHTGGSVPPRPGMNGFGFSTILWGLAVAAGLGASMFLFQQKSALTTSLEKQSTALKACTDREAEAAKLQQQIVTMHNASTKRFALASVNQAEARLSAVVYATAGADACLVSVAGMEAAPQGKSYQLWALKDGKPVSMGVIDTQQDRSALREVACVAGAQGYAVSLEPLGGSLTPTTVVML
jgi:anti-sigma-K factor RskA